MKIRMKKVIPEGTFVNPKVYDRMAEILENQLIELSGRIYREFVLSEDRKIKEKHVDGAIVQMYMLREEE